MSPAHVHAPGPYAVREPVVCVDVGSTWTKGTVVDVATGDLLATGSHPTTASTDVLDGVDATVGALAAALPGADLGTVLACSSAGGGLRLVVVGQERAVTAEAGSRVGLSAGARVVHVAAGLLDPVATTALVGARPDVVLLVGGTDGGDSAVLLHNARRLAASPLRVPVVVAGNAEARDEACRVLDRRRRTAVPTANVLPQIGRLDPHPAREAIRDVFVRHVIGGKGLSRGRRLAGLVRGATPDVVLTGVELLADRGLPGGPGDVVVVDVGGATTDVYSVVTPDPEEGSLHREVVEVQWRSRTVEGDLGVRSSAEGVVEAARAERLVEPDEADALAGAAARRAADPSWLPASPTDAAVDVRLATLALHVALRRHARPPAPPGPVVPGRRPAGGKDLRRVRLLLGSGGALRHATPAQRAAALAACRGEGSMGWRPPGSATAGVDEHYVLAAAGLLAAEHPAAAAELLVRQLGRRLGSPLGPAVGEQVSGRDARLPT